MFHIDGHGPLYITFKDFGESLDRNDAIRALYVSLFLSSPLLFSPYPTLPPPRIHHNTQPQLTSLPPSVSLTATLEISSIIEHSKEPEGGDVLLNYNWVAGHVRLRTFAILPPIMDYQLLKEFLLGVMAFAGREGYYDCKLEFWAKVVLEERDMWRKLGEGRLEVEE